jgi:hypothetical protein
MKTAKQMFAPIVRAQQAELDDAADRQRRANEAEERLDEPLTRREVVEAIESVANEYAGSGFPEQEIICDAFAKLAAILS